MINYKKIAMIGLRLSGYTMMFTGVLELAMVVTAILLISGGLIPQDGIAHEAWFITAIFWIFGGMVLYVRSKSLGAAIVEGLFGAEEETEKS
jgi:hypothetical protein